MFIHDACKSHAFSDMFIHGPWNDSMDNVEMLTKAHNLLEPIAKAAAEMAATQ